MVCAGQTSVDADGGPLHEGDMAAQVGQALDNLETVLREAGYELSDVIRLEYTSQTWTRSSRPARSTARAWRRQSAAQRRRCLESSGSLSLR